MQDCVITANTLLTARLFRPIEGSVKDCEKGHEIDEFGICKHCGTHFDEILDGFREEFNRCVTTVGVNAIVDAFQGTFTLSDFKYHDAGTGTGAEAVGDVALGTPWGGSRVSGTQVEGASANIYRSVATITFNNTFAITEHGLFSASTSGTLLDRTKFTAINVANGDSIQFTFEITFTAGG